MLPRQASFILGALAALGTPAIAQRYDSNVVRDSGQGSTVFVLITGMLGGVSGYAKLEAELLARGSRVVTIDAYRLSLDSTAVTFAAMARRVDAILESLDVSDANVVGHSHGAGVALRLAASYPGRVHALYFLNAGALKSNHTDGVATSLKVAQIISYLPGGRHFVEARLAAGLRENAVNLDWLDAPTQRRYIRPVLDHLDKVAAMARRFAAEKEPDSLPQTLTRVHVPVVVILAGVITPGGAGVEELIAIRPLGNLIQAHVIPGVGHFLQEEAPQEVARILLQPTSLAHTQTIPAYFVTAPPSRRR